MGKCFDQSTIIQTFIMTELAKLGSHSSAWDSERKQGNATHCFVCSRKFIEFAPSRLRNVFGVG